MKVAVLGSSDRAYEASNILQGIGASVVFFNPEKQHFYVQKRALAREEDILGRDRFYDLFRVVYRREFSPHFLQQVKGERGRHPLFSEDDRKHFLEPGDVFVDVDVVVDGVNLRDSRRRAPLLNEGVSKVERLIFSGALPESEKLRQWQRIVFVTQAKEGKLFHALREWVREGEQRELVVVGRMWPDGFSQSLAGCKLYGGYWPLSLDYLSDRKQGYLTLERPDFRGGEDLQTLHVNGVVFDSTLLPEDEPHFCRYEIQESEKGYIVLDKTKALLDEIGKLFSKVQVLLLLFFFVSCAQQSSLKQTNVNQAYTLSQAREYFLSDLPIWANFGGEGYCHRQHNIKFLDYHKLHQRFSSTYGILAQLQLRYNEKYRQQRERFQGNLLTPEMEESIFFQVHREVLMGIYSFLLYKGIERVQLLWVDPAFNDFGYRQQLKKILEGEQLAGAPVVLVSQCLGRLGMEDFVQSLMGEEAPDFLLISAEMFSPFNRDLKLGYQFQLFVDELFVGRKIILYTIQGLIPKALRGAYEIKGR